MSKTHDFLAAVRVAAEVRELRPDYRALLVVAEGLRPGPSDDWSESLLADAEAHPAPLDDPRVLAWAEAFRAFGAKPQRTRPSVTALLRRLPDLPRVDRHLPPVELAADHQDETDHRDDAGGVRARRPRPDAGPGAGRRRRRAGDRAHQRQSTGDGRVPDRLVPRVRSPRTASRRPDDDRRRCRRGRYNPGIGHSSALPDAAWIAGNRPETSDAGH